MQSIYDSNGEVLSRRAVDRFMCWDSTLPADLVERIWNDPRELLAEGIELQDKLRCTVTRLNHAAGPFVWKHHNWGSLNRTVRRTFSRSVARKAWLDGQLLYTAGISTPRPRAFLEQGMGPFHICSYYLADYVEGTSLYRLLRFAPPSGVALQQLAEQVAAIWQQLDGLRVCHNDFKTENLLIDPQGKVWLIDFERLRRCRRVDEVRRRQIRDARDLLHPRNWRSAPEAAEIFRQAIIRTPAAVDALDGPYSAGHPLGEPVSTRNHSDQLITVLIPCYNAADTIRACLESVVDMADEILVADAGSTDDTVRIAEEFGGCRVIQRDGPVDAEFETWAHEHATHPWVLRLLPSEVLNPELSKTAQDVVANKPSNAAFRIAKTLYAGGRPLKFGGFHRATSIRLYRKGVASYQLCDGRVEVSVDAQHVGNLRPRVFCNVSTTLEQQLSEMLHEAGLAAEDANRCGIKPKRLAVIWRALWQFVRSYFIRWGWLDGWAGLQASCLAALSVFLREAMLWELQQPPVARQTKSTDCRHELKLFDPSGIAVKSAKQNSDSRESPLPKDSRRSA